MTTTILAISVPIRTVSEINRHEHWRHRHKRVKAQRESVRWALLEHQIELPSLPMTVLLTRQSPRQLDDDNLRSALKAVRDEIAGFCAVDDRNPLIAWDYAQAKAKTQAVEIRIEAWAGREAT